MCPLAGVAESNSMPSISVRMRRDTWWCRRPRTWPRPPDATRRRRTSHPCLVVAVAEPLFADDAPAGVLLAAVRLLLQLDNQVAVFDGDVCRALGTFVFRIGAVVPAGLVEGGAVEIVFQTGGCSRAAESFAGCQCAVAGRRARRQQMRAAASIWHSSGLENRGGCAVRRQHLEVKARR